MPASKRQPTRAHRHDSAGSTPRVAALRQEAGFSLIEVLVASVVLVVGLMTLFGLLETSLKASASTRAREGASNLAREILEDARTIPLAQISPGAIVGELQALHGLASASSGSWQIVRRGVTYTVLVKECAIDDPKDGLGKHLSASGENPFCQDPGEAEYKAGEAEDPHPENLKRITTEVTWPAKGRKPFVTQVETLTSAGEAPGLNTSQLKVIKPTVAAPTAPVIISPGTASLVFSAQAPASTTAMEWALDGVRQTNPPTHISGTEWQFSWEIPLPAVSDGTYQVSVQAIDATGVYGPPVSISVTLIRTAPAAPKVTYGGFNEVFVAGVKKQVVELQWQPNTERNVIGYRVYNPSKTPVCGATLSLQPSCVDLLQVAGSPTLASANLTYSVVALYHNHELNVEQLSAAISEGPPGTFTLSKTPLVPKEPENGFLEATTLEGAATLNWKAPAAGGAPVVFYRIYRGTQDYTPGRYAVVSAATTTFTDNHAVEKATYWVTAVSATMTESPFTKSVTLP